MKKYWDFIVDKVKNYVVTNWQKEGYFDKGKIIFIGLVAFFLIWKIIYSVIQWF